MDAPAKVGLLTPLAASRAAALDTLAAPVRAWFIAHFGTPTAAQAAAWPVIVQRSNLLLSSPTGSGKTLAAFLPILARLVTEPSPGRCIYVAPLKALANDIQRNLRRVRRSLRIVLPAAGKVHIGLRTGDTTPAARRRLRRRPPDILLTTPESLAVLLAQSAALEMAHDLRWIVVDEVHSFAGCKRGADLALSLERLQMLSDRPVQRIGLSATCFPIAEAAQFLVGTGRPCCTIQLPDRAPLDLCIEPLLNSPGFLPALLHRLEDILEANSTTLVFTNTRALAERLCWLLSQRRPEWAGQVAVHHSSLSLFRRRDVEHRLKGGQLRAVLTSTSLELGIDIGSIDAVVLVHPPGGAVRLLQRVGRAGHAPGRPRRGLVLTASPAELLEAAVTSAAGRSGQWELLSVPSAPLDVLCQHLLGIAACRSWTPDAAYTLVRQAYPYRNLSESDFNACLNYLSGRKSDGTSWLPARLRWQGPYFSIADRWTARLLLRNLGTILSEETRAVVLQAPPSCPAESACGPRLISIGEVDDSFAEHLQPGDRFLLDGRCLQVRNTIGDILVEQVAGRPVVPRWTGEGWPLSASLASRLFLLRLRAAEALREGPLALAELLQRDYALDRRAAWLLVNYFQRQECASEIPDQRTCLVESVALGSSLEYDLHTPLNRAANDAIARVAVRRLVRDFGRSASSIVADLGFALIVDGLAELATDQWRVLLAPSDFDTDLAAALKDSPTLRERFRRVALIGLMTLRQPLGSRRRVGGSDWEERRLYDHVTASEPDFVLLRQALREMQTDYCDAAAARQFLHLLTQGTIRLRRLAFPSPFAESWTQTAVGPVESFCTPAEALEQLHAALCRPAG